MPQEYNQTAAPLLPPDATIPTGTYRSEGAAALLMNDEGQLLLQLREDIPSIPYPGFWGLLGGVIEPGETSEEALRRELLEEIEFAIDEIEVIGKFVTPNRHLLTLYTGTINRRVEEITLHEGAAIRYFSKEELPQVKIVPPLKDVLLYFFFETVP